MAVFLQIFCLTALFYQGGGKRVRSADLGLMHYTEKGRVETMAVERCLGCMKIKNGQQRCPHCGFCEEDAVAPDLLQPGAKLHERYVVGKTIKRDGEGITYLGLDHKTGEAVFIREYMPPRLCTRQGSELVMNVGSETKYKTLQSDFVELYQQLVTLQAHGNIIHVSDLFRENNTVYALYHYFESMTLTQYINENTGELRWEVASKLFRPVFEALTAVHKQGIIHRGLSPETLVVSNDQLIITDFSICSLRMAASEIESSLYPGYAAPEQYSKMMQHGFWTDVYALAAVLYKVLSGTMPSEAPTRVVNDNLISLHRLNATVSQEVSSALEQGMAYDVNLRTRTIKELMMSLYFSKEYTTATAIFHNQTAPLSDAEDQSPLQEDVVIYSDSKMAENHEDQDGASEKKSMAPWKKALIIVGPLVILMIVLLYWLLLGRNGRPFQVDSAVGIDTSSSESIQEEQSQSEPDISQTESSEPQSQVEQVTVDNFINKQYQDIIVDAAYKKNFKFSAEYDFSSTFPQQGVVIDQSVKYGTHVERGTEIILTVSKGPRYVDIPSQAELASWTAADLKAELEKSYLSVTISAQPMYSDTVPQGNVVQIEGALAGTRVDREKTPNVVIVLYPSAGANPNQMQPFTQ